MTKASMSDSDQKSAGMLRLEASRSRVRQKEQEQPLRLPMLELLSNHSLNADEIADILETDKDSIIRQLRLLINDDCIENSQDLKTEYCRLTTPGFYALSDHHAHGTQPYDLRVDAFEVSQIKQALTTAFDEALAAQASNTVDATQARLRLIMREAKVMEFDDLVAQTKKALASIKP